jgi:hypothetical protein
MQIHDKFRLVRVYELLISRTWSLQRVYLIHLIDQLRWVPRVLTSLQIHQENVVAFRPIKVTTCDITVDKPSIVNALESRFHLLAQ